MMWKPPSASAPSSFVSTRDELHRVAVHVVARARSQATGRFGLRVTPGGFGTPEFGPGPERVRVAGIRLVVESGRDGAPSTTSVPLDGASLSSVARAAGVDLDEELSVGSDTLPLGDVERALVIDAGAADAVARWFGIVALALDEVVAELDAGTNPSMVQLWPEHFDVAIDVAFDTQSPRDRRVNLGGSPGDDVRTDPYLYVGPWTSDRPGDASFWNAPFGAVLDAAAVVSSPDPIGEAVEFYRRGLRLLAD